MGQNTKKYRLGRAVTNFLVFILSETRSHLMVMRREVMLIKRFVSKSMIVVVYGEYTVEQQKQKQ